MAFEGGDAAQAIEDFVSNMLAEVKTASPGEIVSVSLGERGLVASVRPSVDKTLANGDTLAAPVVENVPIVRVASSVNGGKGMLVFPVMPGDGCLLIACESSLDGWQSGTRETADPRHHDLTDVVALVGLNRGGVIEPPDNENAWLMFAGASIKIDPGGNVTITTPGAATIKAETVEIDAPETTITGNTTVVGLFSFMAGIVGRGGETGNTMEIVGSINLVQGDIRVDGISSKTHVHNEHDGGTTGPPVP